MIEIADTFDPKPSKHLRSSSWNAEFFDHFDQEIDKLFEPLRASLNANRVFYSASALADHSILWFIFAAIAALTPRERRRGERAFVALAIESGFINLIVKTLFSRERPVYQGERPLPLRQPLTSSFPSGHATAATCAAVLLGEGTSLSPLLFAVAAVVALSRIHVKIHHASDVLGGVAIGALFALVVRKLAPLRTPVG